jgi:hypothetical protein
MNIPPLTREQMRELIEELKEKLKHAKASLKLLKIQQKNLKDDQEIVRKVSEKEREIDELERQLREAEELFLTLPIEDAPDEEQPWYGQIYANGTGYYIKDERGGWTYVTEENAKRELRALGVSHRFDTENTSPLDRTILAIQKRHKIEYAGPLAGYKAGRTKVNGMDILVTSSTELIQPVEGPFPTINAILNGLLKEDRVYFDSFCRVTYEGLKLCLETGKHSNGPVLVLAGPKHCGKSLIQHRVLTPLLGGRIALPYLYISGQTSFNGEQAAAGHHILEDEVPRNIEVRRKVGNHIKKAAANKAVEVHSKGKDIKNLTPFTRLSVSVNDDEECLEVLPPLDDHLTDKLLILLCHKFTFKIGDCVYPANTPAEQAVLEGRIKEEMPAYVHWLLNGFQIPEHIAIGRGGLKAFQNPAIVEKISGTAPELQLREMIEGVWGRSKYEPETEGLLNKAERKLRLASWIPLESANRVYNYLANAEPATLRGILPSVKTCGTYLSRLAEKHPTQFRKYRGHGGTFKYEMYDDPQAKDEEEDARR